MVAMIGVLVLLAVCFTEASKVVIVTPLGPVEGDVIINTHGTDYHAFNGIPYAQPPTGHLRFKAPRPIKPWTDIYISSGKSVQCMQESGGYISGDEDCLYVHIYGPVSSTSSLSVMVYLHGGAYRSGSADLLEEAGLLMNKEVILVSISYRMGPFGFLSTEDSEAPGNYGLQDQITALKWIQQNIGSFGGDKNNITVFASNSGAAMAHLLMLSPLAKGLFHRVILQSGCAINPSSITKISLIRAQTLADKLQCPKAPSTQLLECLRQMPAQDIAHAGMADIDESWNILPVMWAPRVDTESKSPVIPKPPLELMVSRQYPKLPVMIGFVRDEGLLMYNTLDFEEQKEFLIKNWISACDLIFNSQEFLLNEKDKRRKCTTIRKHYIEKEKRHDVFHQRYIDLIGDVMVRAGIMKSVDLMADHQPVYLYSFDFFEEIHDIQEGYLDNDELVSLKGVNHGRELQYIFNSDAFEEDITTRQKHMMEIMTTTWSSFAKTGVPRVTNASSDWIPTTPEEQEYMALKLRSDLKNNYRIKDVEVVEELLKETWFKTTQVLKDEL